MAILRSPGLKVKLLDLLVGSTCKIPTKSNSKELFENFWQTNLRCAKKWTSANYAPLTPIAWQCENRPPNRPGKARRPGSPITVILRKRTAVQKTGKAYPPETNSKFAPENGWLEDDPFASFWVERPIFRCYVLVSGSVTAV